MSGTAGDWAVFGEAAGFPNRLADSTVLGERPAGERLSLEEFEVRRELAKPGEAVTVDGVQVEIIKPCEN